MFKVYKITNIINNKIYIGFTSYSIENRFKRHIYNAKKFNNHTSVLYKAFRKYGIVNFKIEEIAKTSNKRKILKLEIKYIKKYNSKTPNGYNLTNGGEGAVGIKRTLRERKIITARVRKAVERSDGIVYNSMKIAAKRNKTSHGNISKCIRGLRNSAGGYKWKFVENDPKNLRKINRKLAKENAINSRFKKGHKLNEKRKQKIAQSN